MQVNREKTCNTVILIRKETGAKMPRTRHSSREQGFLSIFKRYKYDTDRSSNQEVLDSQLRTAVRSCAPLAHIKSLVSRGADVNCVSSVGYTPLLLALNTPPAENSIDVIQLLCQLGANVNYVSDVFYGDTPLHFAAYLDDSALVELLFRYKANVHARNHRGYTPIHVAAEQGNEASVQTLFLCGADLNSTENYCGYAPLHLARIGQFQHVVEALVSLGATIDQSDSCGFTPIERCCSKEMKDVLTTALGPRLISLESACLSVIRDRVRKKEGVQGFENLPLPFIMKRKLKLEFRSF